MAKRKYLALLTLLPRIASASPWLPSEGEYVFISSAYIADKTSIKHLKTESKAHYTIEQEIKALEADKHKYLDNTNLTPEAIANRMKAIDGRIQNLRNLQSRFSSYYPRRTLSQSLEYGINDRYSLNFKGFSQLKKNFIGKERSNIGFEAGLKIKLKQAEKYIVSMQPSVGIHRNGVGGDHMIGEVRLLLGRSTKHKMGKAFNTMEIAPGFAGKLFECHMDYTTGIETKRGTILTLQTYNSFRPKAHKIYKQTSLEQFSIAKPIMISNYDRLNKVTLQVGYFHEFSISARKAIISGVQFSIWMQI